MICTGCDKIINEPVCPYCGKDMTTQYKIQKTKEANNQSNPNKIKHFGVWYDVGPKNKISRETYAVIDKKVHNKPSGLSLQVYMKNPELKEKKFADDTFTVYSDEWCKKHQAECLKNFDLNMEFFKKLKKEKFQSQLNKLLRKSKKIKEIYSLEECHHKSGVYILVLDEYKQMYIGKSDDIRKRIGQHWSKNKEFDRLIFGSSEESVLSIDSFGPLDTTRIFIYETWDSFGVEQKLVELVDPNYLLNRTAGGINDDFGVGQSGIAVQVLANIKKRKL